MPGAKRGESLKSLDAIDSASVQQGASDRAGGGSVKRWLDALSMVSEYRHERRFNHKLQSPHHIRTALRFNGLCIEAICLARVRSLAWRLHMPAMKAENGEESKSGQGE